MHNLVEDIFTFKSGDFNISVYQWSSKEVGKIKGVVQIAHGMGEQAIRYKEFANQLVENGYIVYANDHKGHGKTAGNRASLGFIGENGFDSMVDDLLKLNEVIKERHPELPIVLFAHSMGAMLAQRYITMYGKTIQGLILSGTAGENGLRPELHDLVKEEIKTLGKNYRSDNIVSQHFGGYNAHFSPNKTDFDFMSRDLSVVDKYLSEPLNGFVFPLSFYDELYKGLAKMNNKVDLDNIPKDLAIYLVSGSDDPVGVMGKEVVELSEKYEQLGIKDVACDIYEGGRHEMLNETNKEEVIVKIIQWIENRLYKKV